MVLIKCFSALHSAMTPVHADSRTKLRQHAQTIEHHRVVGIAADAGPFALLQKVHQTPTEGRIIRHIQKMRCHQVLRCKGISEESRTNVFTPNNYPTISNLYLSPKCLAVRPHPCRLSINRTNPGSLPRGDVPRFSGTKKGDTNEGQINHKATIQKAHQPSKPQNLSSNHMKFIGNVGNMFIPVADFRHINIQQANTKTRNKLSNHNLLLIAYTSAAVPNGQRHQRT